MSAWVVVFAATLAAALGLGGKFSSDMTIDGTPAQTVIDRLTTSFPQASRGSAQVLFHKTDGVAFTAEEQRAIAAALTSVTKVSGVDSVLDPFATQATKDVKTAELAAAQAQLAAAPGQFVTAQQSIDSGFGQIAAAEATLSDSQAQITAGVQQVSTSRADLEATKSQVVDAIAQAQASGYPADQIAGLTQQLQQVSGGLAELDAQEAILASSQAQVDAGRAELEAKRVELVAAQRELTQAKADLPAQEQRLSWGSALAAAAENYRLVSGDGLTALGSVFFSEQISGVDPATMTAVVDALSGLNIPHVEVEFSKELAASLGTIVGPGEVIGLVIAAVVLFIMLGTLVATGLPVLIALVGVGVSALGAFGLSALIDMNATTPTLAVMLGLAVGIDYSLFILTRHRRQLTTGMDVEKSIGLANGTSGSAVLFAGLTVIIALLALNLTGIGFLGLMGNIGALAIVIAVVAAVTLTPALMRFAGLKLLTRRERARRAALLAGEPDVMSVTKARRSLKEIWPVKHPVWTLIMTTGLLLVAAVPFATMRLGLPDGSSEPVASTQYQAYTLTSEGFGAGRNGQITAVVNFDRKLAGDDLWGTQAGIVTELMSVANVTAVVTGDPSPDGKTLAFQVVPTEGPAAASTETVVTDVRALAPEIQRATGGTLGVTGLAAINIDISSKLAQALPLYLGTILVLSVLLMIVVFRSLALPLAASLGFLLSSLAAMGTVTAVYQWGWLGNILGVHDPGPVMNFLPTILIGVLFGLAMDYQLFIATGIREAYVHSDSPRVAISRGVRAGRSVVIAAALIMVAVFGSFAFAESTMIRPMGFGLAVGVLVDAFLVRLLLIPALLRLFGRGAWWLPRWLNRILPNVDIEGARLDRTLTRGSYNLAA